MNGEGDAWKELPGRSVGYLAFGVLALLFVAAVVLLPATLASSRLRARADQLQLQIQEQEILFPLHVELVTAGRSNAWDQLPSPTGQKLAREDVVGVPDLFSKLAGGSGLDLISVTPRVVTLGGSGQTFLRADILVRGPFARLRPFLLSVAGLPALRHIERMELRKGPLSEEMDMSVWLAIQ